MKYLFVILSNQAYHLPLKTNKYHVATILAAKGYDVIFVDPPVRFKALKEFLKHPSINIFSMFSSMVVTNKVNVYKPANIFNFWPFSKINTSLHSKRILNKISHLKNQNPEAKVIMYVYHFDFPDLENFLEKIPHDLTIYDCVDEYEAFPEYANKTTINTGIVKIIQKIDDFLKINLNQKGISGVEWVKYREKYLAKNSDLIFVSAPGLIAKFSDYKEKVHFLPNGCVPEKFDIDKNTTPEPKDLKNIKHPRIGFTGTLDGYKNNVKLIEKTASAIPEYQFILIGPEKLADPDLDLSVLKNMKNVHFLGLKQWEETPKYFIHFDAYFIPYNLNEAMVKGCFPVKYFESLAAGLPTVVTNLPAYKDYDVDHLVSKDDNEFIKNIRIAVENNSKEKIEKRKSMARDNSWDGKVNKQIALISSKLK